MWCWRWWRLLWHLCHGLSEIFFQFQLGLGQFGPDWGLRVFKLALESHVLVSLGLVHIFIDIFDVPLKEVNLSFHFIDNFFDSRHLSLQLWITLLYYLRSSSYTSLHLIFSKCLIHYLMLLTIWGWATHVWWLLSHYFKSFISKINLLALTLTGRPTLIEELDLGVS